MLTRRLGQSGIETSAVGVGGMSFADFYGKTTLENSLAILDLAAELGVTHIDTSNIYGMGRSEEAIGAWLAANPDQKGKVSIATKAAITRDVDGNRCFDNSAAHFEAELDKSLKRMGIDCVDLFYAHRRDPNIPVEVAVENLAKMVEKGKAKSIGLSEVAPSSLRRAMDVYPLAAVQSEYSLSTRAPELGLLQTCKELGVTLVAFSPVGRSFLTDAPLTTKALSDLPFLAQNPRFQSPNYEANIAFTDRFRALAAEMGVPAASLAIAWCLQRGDHVLPIPGTRSVSHFKDLVRGADIVLSEADIAAIETVLPIGWAHGDRYSEGQWIGPERYC